ncbi:hypothetical protein PHMEG_0004117 [Phytophthora megakarya]|uniref:Uncharacterized protein n=1 Tax=Phytophthora megakarya TaxID=4795 RepID=A0A225WUQ7_9STRA|nr:hypothetical protein PHMEG_0004117 [Phytophthora megakarya]
MATVIGPTAINEKKFTHWATQCKALGLLWDTETGSVSIPTDKLEKALGRACNLINSPPSRNQLLSTCPAQLQFFPDIAISAYLHKR